MAVFRATGLAGAALICGIFSGCASTSYVNTLHPEYGAAQHDADLAKCRQQNSQVITHAGYSEAAEVKVDEPAVQACVTTLGWQPAKP